MDKKTTARTGTTDPAGRPDPLGRDSFGALIERSFLGTPAAQSLRGRTTANTAHETTARAERLCHDVDLDPPWQGLTGFDRYAALLHTARDGNRQALDILVAELTPLVWHVVRGQGLDQATAEDVVQIVWLALLRHLNRLSEPQALVAWLITTARREARRCVRFDQERRQRQLNELDDERLPTMDNPRFQPELEALRTERDRQLWTAFRMLSQRCQELLRLTVLAGRAEYRVVAEALHMPLGSIGPTRGRCLGALRELLERGGGSS